MAQLCNFKQPHKYWVVPKSHNKDDVDIPGWAARYYLNEDPPNGSVLVCVNNQVHNYDWLQFTSLFHTLPELKMGGK